jgi:hypothetical protein
MASSLGDDKRATFDLITEITKQIITLSTALIGLGVTFIKDLHLADAGKSWIGASWISLLLAVIFGLATLMASAGVQARPPRQREPDPYAPNLALLGALQVLAFLAGLALSVVAGLLGLW